MNHCCSTEEPSTWSVPVSEGGLIIPRSKTNTRSRKPRLLPLSFATSTILFHSFDNQSSGVRSLVYAKTVRKHRMASSPGAAPLRVGPTPVRVKERLKGFRALILPAAKYDLR